jgi:hypothetical protein
MSLQQFRKTTAQEGAQWRLVLTEDKNQNHVSLEANKKDPAIFPTIAQPRSRMNESKVPKHGRNFYNNVCPPIQGYRV